MKVSTLILSIACAVGFSACCCQSQSMPALRPMPSCCDQDITPTPIKVMPVKHGK